MPEPTGGQERTWARSRRRGPRLRHALALLIALVVGSVGAVTTASGAPICAYDVPTHSCVGVLSNEVTESGGPHTADARERSAMSVADARATSATASSPVVATNTVAAPIESGNYVVSTPAGEYVGQSGNISTRLEQHVASGKFTQAEVDAAQRFAIQGTKLDREIAEQLLIDSKGGIDNLLNKVNPIGPKRFGLMPNQPYVR